MSLFWSLDCAVLQSTDACNEKCADSSEAVDVSVLDGDLQLMYVRCFFCEVGEGVIPQLVFEANYEQLVSYIRVRLEQ